MVLRGAEQLAQAVEVAVGQVMPSMKAFMNDTLSLLGEEEAPPSC